MEFSKDINGHLFERYHADHSARVDNRVVTSANRFTWPLEPMFHKRVDLAGDAFANPAGQFGA